jgi:cytoskeletal protein CcmA (bactofilin family)
MFGKKGTPKTTIDSLIGATTRIDGDVTFSGGLRIDGHVRGDVTASEKTDGLLVVGESGRIEGNVVVGHLIVNGSVQGTVSVAGVVELQAKARVTGELRYRSLELHHGAVVEGIVSHVDGDLMRADLRVGTQVATPATIVRQPQLESSPESPAASALQHDASR